MEKKNEELEEAWESVLYLQQELFDVEDCRAAWDAAVSELDAAKHDIALLQQRYLVILFINTKTATANEINIPCRPAFIETKEGGRFKPRVKVAVDEWKKKFHVKGKKVFLLFICFLPSLCCFWNL
jgi:hypothetical protein